MIFRRATKRFLDVSFCLVAILVLGPLALLGGVLVKATSSGPILFTQQRLGRGATPFEIYKLRTMHVDPDRQRAQTLDHDDEVVMVGRILRRFKIDEIPQIYNVLRGDMSVVGPRPCLPEILAEMPSWSKKRFSVRPGLTGLAQVSGNVFISWEERWKLDVKYVREHDLFLDLWILFRTFLVVLLGESKLRSNT